MDTQRARLKAHPPRTGPLARAALTLALAATLASTASAAPPEPRVLVSGVYLHGFLPGRPPRDSAVRLVNLDPDRPAALAGFALTDRYTPRKRRKSDGLSDPRDEFGIDSLRDEPVDDTPKKKKRGAAEHTLTFPAGASIPPGGELWVAATATGFRQVFGDPPAFEAEPTDPAVPDLPGDGFLALNEGYGTVALLDPRGRVADFVAWQRPEQDNFGDDAFDEVPWNGAPVDLLGDSIYGWKGRVLARARDASGRVLPDTDRAADWPVGFGRVKLGARPVHRVELAGQSHFVSRPLEGRAKVTATSAPDNNHAAFIAALDKAKRSLRVRVYELTNPRIAEAFIRAKRRGVEVLVYLEGAPVGGLADSTRYLVDKLSRAGVPVHFLAAPKGSPLSPRYRFDHSKYVLIDDRVAIIGTENYGRTGVPASPTYGNRGWMIHVEQPDFVRQLRAVWDADYRPGQIGDITSVDASPNDSLGLPYRDPAFTPNESVPTGLYAQPAKPVTVDDRMRLELVLSPDTSLDESNAILGMIARAKTSLYLEQNSIVPFWGKKKGERADADPIPSLPLQAAIAAARRGVKVRVLLDGTWYNAELGDEADNDDTARYLNELAEREGLDLSAKVINLESTHLEKIHAKGVIVDEREVFVGSINWSENAFMGNREVSVVVSHPKVAGYYAELFHRDWAQSLLYAAPLTAATEVRSAPATTAPVIGKRRASERVEVVAERGRAADGPEWVEIAHGERTGWVSYALLGVAEVGPAEARYVIGRDVVFTGRVEAVRPSEKVTQLGFGDPERPTFVAAIFDKDAAAFATAGMPVGTAFTGKTVRLRGRIKAWKVPEIILSKPTQVERLD